MFSDSGKIVDAKLAVVLSNLNQVDGLTESDIRQVTEAERIEVCDALCTPFGACGSIDSHMRDIFLKWFFRVEWALPVTNRPLPPDGVHARTRSVSFVEVRSSSLVRCAMGVVTLRRWTMLSV